MKQLACDATHLHVQVAATHDGMVNFLWKSFSTHQHTNSA
jgi:hypothetical protein